ncbi:MAG: VanZ family protein [Bryobacteraceae bacterium]
MSRPDDGAAEGGTVVGRFLLFTVLLIVYGSLFPFHFGARAEIPDPVWTLTHNWPAIDRYFYRDVVVNVLLYMPLGVLVFVWLRGRLALVQAAVLGLAGGALLSGGMEFLQAFDRPRQPSPLDLITNVLGTAAGIALARTYETALARLSRHPALKAALRPSGAWLLLLFWAASQASPFFPSLGVFAFRHKLMALSNLGAFHWTDVPAIAVDCLAVACLLEAVAGARASRRLLPFVLLLIPAKILIQDRNPQLAELLGAACAGLVWGCGFWRYRRHILVVAWLSVAGLIVRGLAPYHFHAAAGPFSWAPFGATLSYDYAAAMQPVLRKGFLYGASIWLFWAAWRRRLGPTIGIAALLAAIECVQRHLPGRTPEITDPIYALLLAMMLRWLETVRRRRELSAEVIEQRIEPPINTDEHR